MSTSSAQDHHAPPRHGSDEQTHLAKVFAALDAASPQEATEGPPGASAPGGPSDSRPAQPGRWRPSPDDLTAHRTLAKKGEPDSARRVAELYELADDMTEAAAWWRYAADLGDYDAILYVKEILPDMGL